MTYPTTDFDDDHYDSLDRFRACFSIGLLLLLLISAIWLGVSTPKKAQPEVRSVETIRKCHLLLEALAAPGARTSQLEKCSAIIDSDGSSAAANAKSTK